MVVGSVVGMSNLIAPTIGNLASGLPQGIISSRHSRYHHPRFPSHFLTQFRQVLPRLFQFQPGHMNAGTATLAANGSNCSAESSQVDASGAVIPAVAADRTVTSIATTYPYRRNDNDNRHSGCIWNNYGEYLV